MATPGLRVTSGSGSAPPFRRSSYTWNTTLTITGSLTVETNLTVEGTFTFGDAAADNFILLGRMSTGTAAGTTILIDATTCAYGEGMEMRYAISDWSDTYSITDGIGMYLRMENREATSSGSIYGSQIYGVANNVNTKSVWGSLVYAYVKGTSAKTITNVYALQPEITFDAGSSANTITDACVVRAKVTGGAMSDYTVLDGFRLTLGDMDGNSRTYGNGLIFEDDSDMSGTCALTTGININIGCTTGISLAGATTTGFTIGGAFTTGISIAADGTTAFSITSAFTGTTMLALGGTSTNAIDITGSSTTAIKTQTGTFGTGISLGGTLTTGISIGACSGNAIEITTDDKLQFRDSALFIHSSADGDMTISADSGLVFTISSGSAAKKIVFGGETDWGTGATGTVIDGTGYDWVTQTVGRVNADLNATAAAASYYAMSVTASQTTTNSIFGTWTELYFSNSVALTGSSNYSAIWGQVECGTSVTGPDQSDGDFMAAGYFNFITGASFTTGSYVNGIRVQSEISSSTFTQTSNTWTAGVEVLTKTGSYQDWTYGVKISGATTGLDIGSCTTGINFSGTCGTTCIDFTNATFATGDYAIRLEKTLTGDVSNYFKYFITTLGATLGSGWSINDYCKTVCSTDAASFNVITRYTKTSVTKDVGTVYNNYNHTEVTDTGVSLGELSGVYSYLSTTQDFTLNSENAAAGKFIVAGTGDNIGSGNKVGIEIRTAGGGTKLDNFLQCTMLGANTLGTAVFEVIGIGTTDKPLMHLSSGGDVGLMFSVASNSAGSEAGWIRVTVEESSATVTRYIKLYEFS